MVDQTHPARYWHSEGDGLVRCELCPHRCLISEGRRGLCRVREARDGELRTLVYGQPSGLAVDPIEKKPLYHFRPGVSTLSYATVGCNFRCSFCQNHTISQVNRELSQGEFVPPATIVEEAQKHRAQVIAHTYTEPTIYFEYAFDVAKEAHERGLANVFVTNGFTNQQPLRDVAPYLNAANVDLKAFADDTYQKICGGRLQPVLDTIALLVELGVWVEVTTLVVPGMNDSREELDGIARFIASVDQNIPWHISRFYPQYKMSDVRPTPVETMNAAVHAAVDAGLKYAYVGNVPQSRHTHTLCHACGEILIRRDGFRSDSSLRGGRCIACGAEISGVWS